jgi:hypothetical protein
MEIPLDGIMPTIKEPTLGYFTRKAAPKGATPCRIKVHKYDKTYVACLSDYMTCPHCEYGESTKWITVLRLDKPNMVRLYSSEGMAYYDEVDITLIAAHCMGIQHPYSRASFRMHSQIPVHHLINANRVIDYTFKLARDKSGINTKVFPIDPNTVKKKRGKNV